MKTLLNFCYSISLVLLFSCASKKNESNSDSLLIFNGSKNEIKTKPDSTFFYDEFKFVFLKSDTVFRIRTSIENVEKDYAKGFLIQEHLKDSLNNFKFQEKKFSIKKTDLENFLSGAEDGYLLFQYGIDGKKLKLRMLKTKTFVKRDIQKADIISTYNFDNSNREGYFENFKLLKKNNLSQFDTTKHYILFTKNNTKSFLNLLDSLKVTDNNTVFKIYFGYDKSNEKELSLLISNADNLSKNTDFSKLSNTKIAFGNRGSSCCPPQ